MASGKGSSGSEQGGMDKGETAHGACQAYMGPVDLAPAVSAHLSSLKSPIPVPWGCFSSGLLIPNKCLLKAEVKVPIKFNIFILVILVITRATLNHS